MRWSSALLLVLSTQAALSQILEDEANTLIDSDPLISDPVLPVPQAQILPLQPDGDSDPLISDPVLPVPQAQIQPLQPVGFFPNQSSTVAPILPTPLPQLQSQQYQPIGQQYGQQVGQQYGQQVGQQGGQQYGQQVGQQYNQYGSTSGQFHDIGIGQQPNYGLGGAGSINNDLNTGFGAQNNYNAFGSSFGTQIYGNDLLDGIIDPNSFCPEFWIAHKNVCYRFIKSPKRNWYDAKKICQAYKAELISVDQLEKHSFVLKELIVQDQKQNRYWVSAKQTSPNSWVNDDNSALVNVDDSFEFEETVFNQDTLQENLQQNNQYFNRFDTSRQYSSRRDNPLLQFEKTRLVYGYSGNKGRWMFIPSYEFETHLFICESHLLYNPNNINVLQDEQRAYDYGLEITDFKKIPRGPFFIRQPTDTTFDTGKRMTRNDVFVSCLAGGYPTPDYSWYKEEYVNDNLTFYQINPLADSRFTISGGNLIIYNPEQTKDQGRYHCVAENKFGRIRSESVDLNFGYIMEFNLKRSGESGDSNWGKTLFCDPPQHYPGVKYYWSRDFFPNFVDEDQRVFVSNDGALYFSALEIIDRANYSCTVQSLVSSTGRNGPFFPLRVKPHPNYQALLFANTFPKVFPEAPIAGGEVRLECVAFGYPVPSYNWTRKDGGLPRHAYQINYNRVLIIPNATLNDNGEYVCTTKNDRKTLQKSILINIQMKPNFTIPLRDKIKDFNSEVNFVCEANAIPDVNYTWYKNAELLDKEQLDRDKFVVQDNVLTIKFLDPEKDDGMYQCRAHNQLHAVFSSAQLRVLSMKPSFHKRPLESEIYAIYNGNTTIVCDPEAAPRPKFQWKKDGNVIGAGGHRRILPTGTLIITPTSRDDEGVYTCVATNAYGTDESRARLIVLQELRFIQTLPQQVYHQIWELLYLHCDVSYDEVLDVAFIWKHNGQVITDKFNERYVIEYNSLAVHNLTTLDGGDYECIAKSSVNSISTKTFVTVAGPPMAAGGVKVIEIQKTTARLEWIDGSHNGRPIMYYNILGRTNWNKTWVNVSEGVPAYEIDRYTGRKQAEITNLTPWSGYEFSVCAVNDLGIGTPSAPSPLYNTHTDKPYISPRNVGGGGGKIGDLTIKWTPLKSEEQNAYGIHYKIFWRLHARNTEWATEILKQHGNTKMAVVHIPLDNYYTRYDVKVQAINDVGMGPESGVSVIYSAEDMPQVAPQQPVARGYNSTSLNVTWNPVELTREKIRGNLIGHRLKYWKKGYPEEDSVYYLSRTTRPWALIVGLQPDTYYFVKVMVYNAAGEGPESERYMERTYRKAPQKPPSSVHVYGTNPSTVRVVWRYVGVTMEEEPIQGFKVRVWEADQDMSTANDTVIETGNKLESYISNLTPGKAYRMRVLAYSNGGDGRMSSPTLHFQMGNTNERNTAHHLKLNKTILFGILSIYYLLKQTFF